MAILFYRRIEAWRPTGMEASLLRAYSVEDGAESQALSSTPRISVHLQKLPPTAGQLQYLITKSEALTTNYEITERSCNTCGNIRGAPARRSPTAATSPSLCYNSAIASPTSQNLSARLNYIIPLQICSAETRSAHAIFLCYGSEF